MKILNIQYLIIVCEIKEKMKICSKCIYDDRIPYIIYDNNGVCKYCHQLEKTKNKIMELVQKG